MIEVGLAEFISWSLCMVALGYLIGGAVTHFYVHGGK